ncbi:DUF397 domain-containing protein [Actinomadura fulvescens]
MGIERGGGGGSPGGVVWRKSTYTREGHCVEVADLGLVIGVRDSKAPGRPRLELDRAELRALAGRIKAGELDL